MNALEKQRTPSHREKSLLTTLRDRQDFLVPLTSIPLPYSLFFIIMFVCMSIYVYAYALSILYVYHTSIHTIKKELSYGEMFLLGRDRSQNRIHNLVLLLDASKMREGM